MPNQYRSILKATSVFGGTQILQILINLVRSKFIALFIGGVGMGLSSMYMTTITMIISVFGLGINFSVVRNLAKAYNEKNNEEFSQITLIFRRILNILSILSVLFIVLASPLLSKWAFDTDKHTIHFVCLSAVSFFTLLTQGNTALLSGTRRIKSIALSNLIGSVATLITSVPFFYFLGLDGIVPGLIFSTISNYIVTWYFAKKVTIMRLSITWREVINYGKEMILLGSTMVVGMLLSNFTSYIINLGISRLGNLSDLGYFNAGMSITMQVVGLVFSAMGSDYYPRLAGTLSDKKVMNATINEQTEIVLYLAVPILAFFMVFSPVMISLLLSEEFQIINSFIKILCIGMLLKAAAYALGYISFAHGDKKTYLCFEVLYGNIINPILSLSFYYALGLVGLAISFVITYTLYFYLVRIISIKRYKYTPTRWVNLLILISFFSLLGLLVLNFLLDDFLRYIVCIPVSLIISGFYIYLLNQRTYIVTSLLNRFRHAR